jgi:hypothetical protein
MKILQFIMNTILYQLKMLTFSLRKHKVEKLSMNGKSDSTVIGPAFRG